MKTKWHENIPSQGVLCKKQNGAVRLIKSVIGDIAVFDNQCKGISVDDLTPLTAAEWWQFAPWQDIKTMPNDTWVIIIDAFNAIHIAMISGGQWNESYFIPVKWIPLS